MSKINTAIRLLARLIFKQDYQPLTADDISFDEHLLTLHSKLVAMINDGEINEAENLLYEEMDPQNIHYIRVALDFYDRLSKLDDDELKDADFKREEILDGIEDLKEFYEIKC